MGAVFSDASNDEVTTEAITLDLVPHVEGNLGRLVAEGDAAIGDDVIHEITLSGRAGQDSPSGERPPQ